MNGPLVVIGAVNVDLVVAGAPLPRPGETVTGGSFARYQGGKGGNQATAAARALGGERNVVMVAAVGDDDLGADALRALEAEGVDVSFVRVAADAATGVALIAVDEHGENQISVAPGANDALGDPTESLDRSRPALVLASAEVRASSLEAAATWCHEHRVPFVLNPAPFAPALHDLLDRTSILTPNRRELEALSGAAEPLDGARVMRAAHPELTVIVTLGEQGATVVDDVGEEHVIAPTVDVVDATGAGDCLSGVLAAGLVEGLPLRAAAERAVRAATRSVTLAGARGSY